MSLSTPEIRPIKTADNSAIEVVIREVLTEFGANKPGFAWQDDSLSALSTAYSEPNEQYWVVSNQGSIIGGCGIAALSPKLDGVCELQKMYLLPAARGKGLGDSLITTALEFASRHFRWCYLETLANMSAAENLYRSTGFMRLPKPIIETEHSGCDRWYLRELIQ
jgi:putative acetyltransferase